jgi:hypothetical protein
MHVYQPMTIWRENIKVVLYAALRLRHCRYADAGVVYTLSNDCVRIATFRDFLVVTQMCKRFHWVLRVAIRTQSLSLRSRNAAHKAALISQVSSKFD